MAREHRPPWQLYKEEMDSLCLMSEALWEPVSADNKPIRIGDVGFVRRGQFNLLFHAGSSLDEVAPGDNVPSTFRPLTIGKTTFRDPRPPDCLRVGTVEERGAGLDVAVPTPLPLEPGAHFSFKLTGNHGAALRTRYQTHMEDTQFESTFERYVKRHYESWVTFVHQKGYGDDVQPVLVSGFDMTRDFAMLAYSNKGVSLEAGFEIDVPMFISTSASIKVTRHTESSPHFKCGPHPWGLPAPTEQTIGFPSSQSADSRATPDGFNQCVFIRYYTARLRKWLPPKVFRAAAGPHDLGSGNNRGETLLELMAQSNLEPTTSGDDDLGGRSDLTTEDTDSERIVVVRNTPYDGEYSIWDIIADYIFQDPKAVFALMHHRDTAWIRMPGETDDISTLLTKSRPHIVVDSDGVGRITRQEIQQPGVPSHITTGPRPWTGGDTAPIPKSHSTALAYPAPPWGATAKERWCLRESVANADKAMAVRALVELVIDKHGRATVLGLEPEEAKICVETLDYGITACPLRSTEKRTFFLMLRRLAERHGLLPDRMRITEKIEVSDEILVYGGFADTRLGTYNGGRVAVKAMRVSPLDNFQKIRKRFYREVVLWERLSHPNVLKLVGVWEDMEKGQFATVAEWMEHGSIMDYIKQNSANRLELLHGAAQGLKYIHDAGFAHGDLKGPNILVTNSTPPRACLADFGFITTAVSPGQELSCSAQLEGGTMGFMAPELLVPERFGKKYSVPTPQADVYAFGLVIFQVLTGETPFRDHPTPLVAYVVVEGTRPDKPANASAIGFSDSLWTFTQRCWSGDIESRPGAGEVVMCLGEAVASWDGLMPPCAPVEKVTSDSKGVSDSEEYTGLFLSSGNIPPRVVQESPTESQIPSGPFTSPSSKPLRERLQEVVTNPREGLQPELWVPTRPLSGEPRGNLHVTETSPHLNQHRNPLPSNPPQKKWKGIKHIGSSILRSFGSGS